MDNPKYTRMTQEDMNDVIQAGFEDYCNRVMLKMCELEITWM